MKRKSFLIGVIAAFSLMPGCAWADNVYTIYPIPQQQTAVTGTARFTDQVNVIVESGIDAATRKRLEGVLADHGMTAAFSDAPSSSCTNIYIGVNGSGSMADSKGAAIGFSREVFSKEGKYDRHCLSLTVEGGLAQVVILGENTNAAFYALASLEQMLDGDRNAMPCVFIGDYADQQSRGIVEGYYGYPYSISVKKDLMKFMMRNKMNTYLYGAKSDPYHSEKWQDAYPTTLTAEQEKNGWLSQDMISELSEMSHDTKVNFIWAIHPGNNFLGSNTVVADIMSKFDKMYQLGVRQFAVFVDDVSIPSDDAGYKLNADRVTEIQRALEAKYNTADAVPADTVQPLHFVPQIYCSAFAGGGEAQRKAFFEALAATPNNVTIYTTGWGVWSVPNSSDLNQVKQYLGRDAGWWWNYPCNDNADARIFPMDTYTNFVDMPAISNNSRLPEELLNGCGIVSNPMQQGEVAKIPLFSVANYAWNTSGFDNKSSWEASFPAIVGKEKAETYRFLAEYLRYGETADLQSLIDNYKTQISGGNYSDTALKERLKKIVAACMELEAWKDSENESDRLLYNDLKPWLLKLKQMAASSVAFQELLNMEENEQGEKWEKYAPHATLINKIDTDANYTVAALEGMGSGISVSYNQAMTASSGLEPFVKFMKERSMEGYFKQSAETKAKFFSNIEGAQGTCTTNNDGSVFIFRSTNKLEKNQYVGISLPRPVRLDDVTIADTIIANYTVLYSGDGYTWVKYSDKETMMSDFVKFMCIKNESDTPRTLRFFPTSSASFSVKPAVEAVTEAVTIPSGEIYEGHTKEFLADGRYDTYCCLKRNQQNNDAYTLQLASPAKISEVRLYVGTVNGDYMNKGRVEVSADGNTWTALTVKGNYTTDFTMSLPQVKSYSSEVSYCDFVNNQPDTNIKFIRLRLVEANTNKWMRLYEIEYKQDVVKEKCVSFDEKEVTELTDALAHTSMPVAPTIQWINYYFQQRYPVKSVVIYQDLDNSAERKAMLSVKVASSPGSVGYHVADLTDYKQVVDLTEYKDAIGLHIAWAGFQAPIIYEIVEVLDDAKEPEITGIRFVEGQSSTQLRVEGNRLFVSSPAGIAAVNVYTPAGKMVLSQKLSGVKQAQVPVTATSDNVHIVKVSLSDGRDATYKVFFK